MSSLIMFGRRVRESRQQGVAVMGLGWGLGKGGVAIMIRRSVAGKVWPVREGEIGVDAQSETSVRIIGVGVVTSRLRASQDSRGVRMES
jgi:hypothetical protein